MHYTWQWLFQDSLENRGKEQLIENEGTTSAIMPPRLVVGTDRSREHEQGRMIPRKVWKQSANITLRCTRVVRSPQNVSFHEKFPPRAFPSKNRAEKQGFDHGHS